MLKDYHWQLHLRVYYSPLLFWLFVDAGDVFGVMWATNTSSNTFNKSNANKFLLFTFYFKLHAPILI